MNKLLITGASGFVGRHVLQLLQNSNYEVHAVSRNAEHHSAMQLDVIWHHADLFQADEIAKLMNQLKPSHCMHLAWEATPGLYWHSLANFRWVEATLSLVQSFQAAGGQRFVAAGSCAEYLWGEEALDERTSPLAYTSPYGACKNDANMIISRFAQYTGLSTAWCRLFFMYGPHEASGRLIPFVIQALLRSETAQCSEGIQERDYLYIEDVASALITVLNSDAQGAVNIASGAAIKIRDLVKQTALLMNLEHLVQFALPGSISGESDMVLANINRLSDLNWKPEHSLEEGLTKTITWWRESLKDESQ